MYEKGSSVLPVEQLSESVAAKNSASSFISEKLRYRSHVRSDSVLLVVDLGNLENSDAESPLREGTRSSLEFNQRTSFPTEHIRFRRPDHAY